MKTQVKFSIRTLERLDEISRYSGHAVLIIAPRWGGADQLADMLVEKLLRDKSTVTGTVNTIDGSVDTSIEAVRSLQSSLKLTTTGSEQVRRIVTLKSVDSLGVEAQNALLKTTEEPPSDTMIIATAEKAYNLLPTLRSRFIELIISPMTLEEANRLYSDSFEESAIKRAHEISEGGAQLLHDLLYESEDNQLSQAIDNAKEILLEDRYTRLLRVDLLAKEDQEKLCLLFEALKRLIRASIQHSSLLSKMQLQKRLIQLEAVLDADNHLRANVQPKVVLDRLFVSL